MFLKMKYVMFRDDGGQGVPYPVLFSEMMEHKAMVAACGLRRWGMMGVEIVAVSAGFVDPQTGECYGESISTGLKANEEFDTKVMQTKLGMGA
jgi:hypothetical protein